MPQKRRHPALTLLEALMASVLLAVVVTAVSQALLAGQMQSYEALHRARAITLAEALMDEILRLPYDDPDGASAPGPEAGESGRGLYDNIDDFHGFSESAGAVADAAGTLHDGAYQVFSREVTIVADSQTVAGFGSPLPGLTVTVTVQDDRGTTWAMTHFYPQPQP